MNLKRLLPAVPEPISMIFAAHAKREQEAKELLDQLDQYRALELAQSRASLGDTGGNYAERAFAIALAVDEKIIDLAARSGYEITRGGPKALDNDYYKVRHGILSQLKLMNGWFYALGEACQLVGGWGKYRPAP